MFLYDLLQLICNKLEYAWFRNKKKITTHEVVYVKCKCFYFLVEIKVLSFNNPETYVLSAF